MEPIEFEGCNVIYAKDQPEYIPLPAKKTDNGHVTTCWKLSADELAQIQETGVIWLHMLTFNQPLQAVLLSTENINFE